MSRLTSVDGTPRRGPAHRARRLGKSVLVTRVGGEFEILSPKDYAGFLRSGESALPEPSSELRWDGPRRHLIELEGPEGVMCLELARQAVDFAFCSGARPLVLELACVDAARVMPVAWFCAQWATRRAEWGRREASLVLRFETGPAEEDARRLRALGAALRWRLRAEGSAARVPRQSCDRVLLSVEPGARAPELWAELAGGAGARSVLVEPGSGARSSAAADSFLGFYRTLRAALLSRGLSDEWEEAFLARQPLRLPGVDVWEGLAYGADGSVYTGEHALAARSQPLRLGTLGTLRYGELSEHPAVRACLAAALPLNQPMCFQCAYRPYCALSPALNLRLQGTVWGQTPANPQCRARMGLLDAIFAGLCKEKSNC